MSHATVTRVPELLAPAGDRERLEAALHYGADAVYLAGERFGMRSAPDNFTADGIREAIDLCHKNHVQVHITCNVLPRCEELDALPEWLALLDDAGADAIIAADIGVMALVKRHAPHCALHVSTQFGVVNHLTATQLYEQGAARVVLARELSLPEIRQIRARTPRELELECFVHGAMCVSVSGRCLLSNYFTGRDANHGDCTQPCRWKYGLVEQNRPDRVLTIGEEEGGSYILNANDLCMLEHIAELAEAGVSSFKIEVRAKAAYYVAVTTNAYRAALDGYAASGFDPAYRPAAWMRAELDRVSHRPYGTGFYFGMPSQETVVGGYVRDWEVVAVVEGWEDGRLYLSQRNRFFAGETASVLTPGERPFDLTLSPLFDSEDQPLSVCPHPTMRLWMPCVRPLAKGSLLRCKRTEEVTP